MSEIKGQLLGIILVLTIFGLVGGVLTAIFYSMATTVEAEVIDKVENYDREEIPENPSGAFDPRANLQYLSY